MSESLSVHEVASCPACVFGYEPTSSTGSAFCRVHRPKSPRSGMTRHTLAYDPKVTEALKALPSLYETDGTKGDRPAVKLFDIASNAFWVVWEYDADKDLGFGLCDLGFGFPEMGYVSVAELRGLGYRVEKDSSVETLSAGYASRGMNPPAFMMGEEVAS